MSYTVYDPIQTSLDPDLFAPLAGGTVYFGVPNGNPQAVVGDRVQVYLARQGLADLAISQPVSIGPGGHWYFNGNPAQIKILVPYCVQAFNSLGVQEYYAPSAGDEVSKFNALDAEQDAQDAEIALRIKLVDDYADLSITSDTIGHQISLKGYTTQGDGGGDIFDVVSSSGLTANSGTIAINGAIAFKRKYLFLTVKMFGAKCDGGTTDDTAAIQAAIDFACPLVNAGYPVALYLNPGGCKITTTLNMTNSRTGGTKLRDGFRFFGDGLASHLLGETGDGHAVIEVTGSQWLVLEDFTIFSGSANKSTVGVYQGISTTLPQTQNQAFNRLKIFLHDDALANGGNGTIACWNYGAEENTYNTVFFMANRAAVFSTQNASMGGYLHSYQTLSTQHSLGVTSLVGECFFVSIGRRFAPLFLLGVNSFTAPSLYLSNVDTFGTNDYAIEFYSSCVGVSINGTIEQLGTLHVPDTIIGSDFRLVFGGILNSAAPIIKLERGGAGIIQNSEFKITNNDPTSQTRALLSLTPAAVSEQVSCYIEDSSFKTNLPAGYIGLQENLVWNPRTNNVHFSGANWSYEIKDYTHSVALNAFSLGVTATVTKISGIKMPTVIAASSAMGLAVKVKGMVGTTPAGDNARSTVLIDGTCCLSTSQNGVITYGAATNVMSTAANVNAAGNDITGVALTLVADTNPLNAAIKLTPTITGVNGSTCTFTGRIEMTWSGHAACAPMLLRGANTTP